MKKITEQVSVIEHPLITPGRYIISTAGWLRDTKTGRIRRPLPISSNGYVCKTPGRVASKHYYMSIALQTTTRYGPESKHPGKNRTIIFGWHALLAGCFIPKPKGTGPWEVDHIDHDALNNDLSNLRWVTRRANTAVVSEATVREMLKFKYKNPTYNYKEISERFGVRYSIVHQLFFLKRIWRDLKAEFNEKVGHTAYAL